jgi:hypothetical protein
MVPLALDTIRDELKNLRTATLELDSLYGPPAPRDPGQPQPDAAGAGHAAPRQIPALRPRGRGNDNDLPREPRSDDILHARAARIGDPRNDQNLIVAQLAAAEISQVPVASTSSRSAPSLRRYEASPAAVRTGRRPASGCGARGRAGTATARSA